MSTSYEGRAKGGVAAAKVVKAKYLNKYLENPNICQYCRKAILPRGSERLQDVKVRRFCNRSCSAKYKSEHTLKKEPKIREPRKYERLLLERTKGDLFSNRKNWQSARTSIQKWARRVYFESGKTKGCFICGYDKHTEICHIKSVSDFPDSATIKEINNIENLVPLCPTHHWEFDEGILKL